jgi:hypothetical protein
MNQSFGQRSAQPNSYLLHRRPDRSIIYVGQQNVEDVPTIAT